ncbi:hypothetical protein [Streptomyces sp. NPDC058954]|uniref:hypothetical protein n=1 Tax=Streptomyces sp. NPDC058954 TaxID=3346677 RepID=UPI003682C2B0
MPNMETSESALNVLAVGALVIGATALIKLTQAQQESEQEAAFRELVSLTEELGLYDSERFVNREPADGAENDSENL